MARSGLIGDILKGKAVSCLQEDNGGGRSHSIPRYQGKEQGISRNRGVGSSDRSKYHRRFSGFGTNSLQIGTGNCLRGTGKLVVTTGSLLGKIPINAVLFRKVSNDYPPIICRRENGGRALAGITRA